MTFNGTPDITGHASRHVRIRTVGRLKFAMDQYLVAIDADANEAVGAACRDRELLSIDNFKNLDVLSPEGETGDIVGIGLNQVFGNRIELRHSGCSGALGKRDGSAYTRYGIGAESQLHPQEFWEIRKPGLLLVIAHMRPPQDRLNQAS